MPGCVDPLYACPVGISNDVNSSSLVQKKCKGFMRKLFVLSTGIYQSTLLVSHNGIDDENCGIRVPCQTITYTISKRAKDGDVIRLETDLSKMYEPFIIKAQPLFLQNITLIGTNDKPIVKGDRFIFDEEITPSNLIVRYVTVRIVNLILKGTGIVRFRKKSGTLNVVINNCIISDLVQKHTTLVMDTLSARTTFTVKESIIYNFFEATRIKSNHIKFQIELSNIFNSRSKNNKSYYPKLVTFEKFESLLACFIKSNFSRHSLIDLKYAKYGTSTINIKDSHFESVVLNTGMILANTSLAVANSSFSKLFSSKGLMIISSSSAHFENCNFSRITSYSQSILSFYSNSNVSFIGCYITNNTNKYSVINLNVTQAFFTSCTFEINNVTGKGGRGGAISAVKGSNLQIQRCFFKGNQAKFDGGAVYVGYTNRISFKLCIFENNIANANKYGVGGAISAAAGSHLEIIECFFKGNQASYWGGAIHMRDTSQSLLQNCIFENNVAYNIRNGYGGAICGYSTAINGSNITDFGQLTLNITSCFFRRNHATYGGGAISIASFYMVHVQRTKFEDNVAQFGGALAMQNEYMYIHINIHLLFSSFIRNKAVHSGGAIFLSRAKNLTVRDSTFKSNSANSQGGSVYAKDSQSSFQRCIFENNTVSDQYGGGGAIRFTRKYKYGGDLKAYDVFNVCISWCLFKGNKAKYGAGAISSLRNNLLVNNSTFENNVTGTRAGGALALLYSLFVSISWCNFTRNKAQDWGGAIFHGRSGLLSIRNTHFLYNIADSSRAAKGGALFTYSDQRLHRNSSIEVFNCSFKGNMAQSVGGAICNMGGTSLSIIASSFQTSSYFHNRKYIGGEVIYSLDKIFLREILIQNMNNISTEDSLVIHTSKGRNTKIHDITVRCYMGKDVIAISSVGRSMSSEVLTFVNVKCASCPPQFYSLSEGIIGPDLINQTHIHCSKCPFGGECKHGQIKASDNFWGYPNNASIDEISFSICPFGYCCVGSQCKDYNSCRTGRQGILCGQCEKHLTESIGTPDCLKHDEDCLHLWFWGIVGTAGILYVLFFSFQREVCMFFATLLVPEHVFNSVKLVVCPNIKKIVDKIFRRNSYTELITNDISCGSVESEIMQFEVQDEIEFPENEPNNNLFSGCLKIVIYFYQTSVLYKVYSEKKSHRYILMLQEIVSTLFNLRTDGLFSQDLLWCPFDRLKAVPKLLFKTSFTFYLVTLILFLSLVSKIIRHFMHNDNTSAHHSRLYCCFLRMLIISYSSITKTCLTLLFCIDLGPIGNVLYIDGSIRCYQWWQFLNIFVALIWIGSFPVGIYAASWLTHRNKLPVTGFLLSLLFPLPTIVYFVFIRICYPKDSIEGSDMRGENITESIKDKNINELLEVLEGPFRKYNGTDISCNYNLPWESILIAQRLVLIITRTFLADVLIRSYVMLLFTILFLVCHIYIQPFSGKLLNYIQTISLTMLVTICALNTVPGYIYMNPLNVSSYTQEMSETFNRIETILILVVPFVISLCIVVFLSIRILQLVHLIVIILIKLICLCCKKKMP